ncbi:alpha/beta hydrolase [Nocardioides pelophilus]|uniref:alpha/beta hydrolase n=1 Tax=Nocardioides pelophilus TaxID=2172019 RepID=UPI0016000339|nr:alpha/beta fold hydrolase [Nocardioides pelophilus]
MTEPSPYARRARRDITFPSGDDTCAAWLYSAETSVPGPVIVMAHGLGAVKEMRLDAYAERFVAAGYSCLVFDYRHFGASSGEPRQLLDVRKQLEDWAAAVSYVRSLEEFDPDKVVVWGTSFGGGHVIRTAERDHRIAAAVAQCPFTDGLASVLAIDTLTSLRVTARGLRDLVTSRLHRPPHMVPTSGEPGTVALMSAPDAKPGYLALVPDGQEVINEVAARVALSIPFQFPGRSAAAVECPILFAVCETDSVAPARATKRHAAKAPKGEIRTYPEGHFDIYVGEAFERVVTDQIAFLTRHVPPAT